MFIIVLNQSNIVPNGKNNSLVYKFPNSVKFENNYIAVSSISMYYSWFNIAEQYLNNKITYTWYNGGVQTTYTITIPDGLYEISDINKYFQFVMIENGTYLINSSGEYVYYFEIQINPNRYAVQLNTFQVPTVLPAGWSTPANFAGFPTTVFNPAVSFLPNFSSIVGYIDNFTSNENINGAYVPPPPNESNNYVDKDGFNTLSYLSNKSPDVQPNSSVFVSVSNINNPYSVPSSIIYSLAPNVAIGEQIIERPPNFMWNKLINGTYNEIRLQFLGVDYQPLNIRDPQMNVLLVIADDHEIHK